LREASHTMSAGVRFHVNRVGRSACPRAWHPSRAGIGPCEASGRERIAVTPVRQVLFVQGAGAGAHDEWDIRLVESLRRELGDGYEVHYPLMPDEHEPTYAAWSAAVRRELTELADDPVVVGHSVGGTILVAALAEQRPEREPAAIVLIAAPFVGPGGWPGDEFELAGDLGARLPREAEVHLFHGLQDETAPPAHAELYDRAISQAQLHLLPGRDHQLNGDLREVARVIARLSARSVTGD
jgi:pimeloyl-ACP methyl ester carboxylesterase